MSDYSLFTSESVSAGHPDKMSDQISDAILDTYLTKDPDARVAVETLVKTGMVVVAGEVTTSGTVTTGELEEVIRQTVLDIGFDSSDVCFDGNTCAVINAIGQQSADIALGTHEADEANQGAGDQGLMFGFACRDTEEELMPLPIALSHRILDRLNDARFGNEVSWLRPDSKSQVTVEYDGLKPVRIDTVVVSTQHSPDVANEDIQNFVVNEIINPLLPAELVQGDITYHVNPTGRFVTGGPHGDCGLTGRKIIVDTYGGWGRHGGGAFSGKDPTKVDRSAAYMSRHVAKNIVAAGLAERCEVQLAYAIGVTDPVSVHVDTQGTGEVDDAQICAVIREFFPLSPGGIIDYLDLRKPIYRKTAAGGHFGRSEFSWESTSRAEELKAQF